MKKNSTIALILTLVAIFVFSTSILAIENAKLSKQIVPVTFNYKNDNGKVTFATKVITEHKEDGYPCGRDHFDYFTIGTEECSFIPTDFKDVVKGTEIEINVLICNINTYDIYVDYSFTNTPKNMTCAHQGKSGAPTNGMVEVGYNDSIVLTFKFVLTEETMPTFDLNINTFKKA